MRFGWMAAAAAMVCAMPAAAQTTTIRQNFYGAYQTVASPPPATVGNLTLGAGQQILSATIDYTTGVNYSESFSTSSYPDPSSATITYSGTSGFDLQSLNPTPIHVGTLSPFAGTMTCSGSCLVGQSFSGSISVPTADFGVFLSPVYTYINPTGNITATITSSQPGLQTQQNFQVIYAEGTITYVIGTVAAAVPEPATWAMLLVGVGAVGVSLRRRSRPVLAA